MPDEDQSTDAQPEQATDGAGYTQIEMETRMLQDMGNRLSKKEDLTDEQKAELLSAIMREM